MPFLSVEGVSKRFDGVTAVDHVSFAVDRGQVVGFLGPNGAGKSTTMRMITQYYEPDTGVIKLDGVPLTDGLYPNQRVEIPRLIGALGKDRTVILSTHVLPEVQHTCSRLLIISRGKIVADGPVDRLIRQAEGAVEIAVEAAGTGVAEALGQLPGVRQVSPAGPATDGRVAVTLTADRSTDLRPEIFGLAKARGWTLDELHLAAGSLEDLFHQLTSQPA